MELEDFVKTRETGYIGARIGTVGDRELVFTTYAHEQYWNEEEGWVDADSIKWR